MISQKGFTLLEILISISIVSILVISIPITLNFRVQVDKGNDVSRKKNLNILSTKLDEFYTDKNHYPLPEDICYNDPIEYASVCPGGYLCCNVCGKVSTPDKIKPYTDPLPCDPQYSTRDFLYQIPDNTNPQSYKIYSHMSISSNYLPGSCSIGCGPSNNYFYGISSQNESIN